MVWLESVFACHSADTRHLSLYLPLSKVRREGGKEGRREGRREEVRLSHAFDTRLSDN